MRVLFVSGAGDGLWFSWLLRHNGHDVDVVLHKSKFSETLAGLIPSPIEVDDASPYDLVVYDTTGYGKAADAARAVTPVIGDSLFADKLEHDRVFGLEFMEKCGIHLPPWKHFDNPADAIRWLRKTHKRTVFKPAGKNDDSATTYVSTSGEDMEKYIDRLFHKTKVDEFVLQEFVSGTEVSTEAWFNGEEFYALNHDLEEKKFMDGGIGPNTGCSGNVLWMPNRNNALFEHGLARTKEALREVSYVGVIDLNAIVTEGEVFGLEWTPRFGYEGACNLTKLLPIEFGEFLYNIATGRDPVLGAARHNFAATIRLSVPPYPNPSDPKKYAGTPIQGLDIERLDSFYISDIKLNEAGELETIGTDGLVGAPIGCSETMSGAFKECEVAISRLQIPNLQWRTDVAKCCEKRYYSLLRDGWLRDAG